MNQANQMDEAQLRQAQMELSRILSGLKHEVPIYLFTRGGHNEVFNDAARQALRFFRQLTDKIVLREYDLSHEMAQQMGISAPQLKKLLAGELSRAAYLDILHKRGIA